MTVGPTASPTASRAATTFWLWFAGATAVAALLFGYHYLDDLTNGVTGTLPRRAIEEITGVYAFFVLLPGVRWLTLRFPWSGKTWPLVVVVQLLAAVIFSVLHTTLMALSREGAFAVFHLGRYDYGNMAYRYPMEFSNDLLSYAVVVGFMYLVDRYREAQRRALAAARLEAELASVRLANLRLQLQPHFLFNTLNAISAVMYENPAAADTMLVRLSDFVRRVLDASDVGETSLEEELRSAALYVDLMRGRLENGLHLDCRCEDGLADALVPSMLLQPLVENAIVHGRDPEREALKVTIEARREGSALLIRVGDDGCGVDLAAARDGRGLGATKARLHALYGAEHDFEITPQTTGGTHVNLRLPLRVRPDSAAESERGAP